jgi:hypothetical protein
MNIAEQGIDTGWQALFQMMGVFAEFERLGRSLQDLVGFLSELHAPRIDLYLHVTRPKLLQLAWFARLSNRVLVWLAWAHAVIDPIKLRIKRTFQMFAPERAGRAMRVLMRIRRRMQGPHAAT